MDPGINRFQTADRMALTGQKDSDKDGHPAGSEGLGTKKVTQGGRGFTLLELVLVMVVISLFIGMALPRLPDISGARIQKTARKVAITLQTARMRAITLRRYYRVEFDVDAEGVMVSYFGPEGNFIEDDAVGPYHTKDADIVDMITSTRDKVIEGTGFIYISPRGFIEPSMIHLRDMRGRDITVSPAPAGGRIRILEGYVDLDSE